MSSTAVLAMGCEPEVFVISQKDDLNCRYPETNVGARTPRNWVDSEESTGFTRVVGFGPVGCRWDRLQWYTVVGRDLAVKR